MNTGPITTPAGRRRATWPVGLGAALAVGALATACTSASGSTSAPNPTVAAPTATTTVVSAQPTSLGTVLVNQKGLTVYDFANDKGSASTCTGTCAANWLPVPAPTTIPPALPGVTGSIGATTRSDGTRQLTVAGHPVYTFVGDTAPGQTNGENLTLNGGLWTAVSPAGAPVRGPAPTSTSTGGGNGY